MHLTIILQNPWICVFRTDIDAVWAMLCRHAVFGVTTRICIWPIFTWVYVKISDPFSPSNWIKFGKWTGQLSENKISQVMKCLDRNCAWSHAGLKQGECFSGNSSSRQKVKIIDRNLPECGYKVVCRAKATSCWSRMKEQFVRSFLKLDPELELPGSTFPSQHRTKITRLLTAQWENVFFKINFLFLKLRTNS